MNECNHLQRLFRLWQLNKQYIVLDSCTGGGAEYVLQSFRIASRGMKGRHDRLMHGDSLTGWV